MPHKEYITLVNNRNNLSARGSIEAIVKYARYLIYLISRDQDRKLFNSRNRVVRAGLFLKFLLVAPPALYAFWHLTSGYWRNIYPTSPLSSFVEIAQLRLREYMVPEIYLKEREKRKIEIKLKETEELREIWHK